MPKLHEILAVDGDLDGTAKKIMGETIHTFQNKPDHFLGSHRSIAMFDEDKQNLNSEETKALVTTVGAKLDYTALAIIRYLDNFAKKEATNHVAQADLVVAGVTLAKDLPGTMLLGLESKLKSIRAMYEAIPTLQPGQVWEPDGEAGPNIYKASEPEIRFRTEKKIEHKILVQPTKEHPAQIEKWTADVPVGKITVRHWSGMLSPASKSELLERIDILISAVKKARQRANTTEVVSKDIGAILFNFIHG